MKFIPHVGTLALLAISVIGCASAPIHYHTLQVPEDSSVPAAADAEVIDVRVAYMPAFLERSELVVLGGPGEVTLLENEQWASPLISEIREAVRFEIRNRLSQAAESDGLRTPTKLSVTIDVERLEAQPGRYALIDATWSASAGRVGEPSHLSVANCRFKAYENIGAGYPELVRGYQRELIALADAIVSAMEAGAGSCR
jgi:uncharacterized protein